MPAAAADSWKRRLSCRVVRCCPCRRPGNSQRSPTGTPASKRVGRTFHHCRSEESNSGGSMTCRSLSPFDCTIRMIICALSMSPALSRSAKAAAIAQREHHLIPEAAGHGKQSLGLVWAHGERQLLRLFEVVDLGRQIVPPQRDAEQEPHAGHDAIAIADADAGLAQMQLEAANVVGGCRVRGTLEECR